MRAAAALLALVGSAAAERIVIAGDSWGTEGDSAFRGMLSAGGSAATVKNIAISGSTAQQWVDKHQSALKSALGADTTNVWISLGGNDAIAALPGCGLGGKSASDCADAMVAQLEGWLTTLIDTVHTAAPKARVLGFGYDIMGMSNLPICPVLARGIFPQCISNNTDGFASCWNTQFVKIQGLWAKLAAKYAFVDTVSMLGTLQAASGDKAASVGHPDLAKFSPTQYMQANCIHPTRGYSGGFGLIFKQQWPLYWQKQLM